MMMNVISNTLNDYRVSNIEKIVNGFSYRITDNGVLSINGDCISNQNIIYQQVSSKKLVLIKRVFFAKLYLSI